MYYFLHLGPTPLQSNEQLRQYLPGAWVLPIHSRELGFGHSIDTVHGCKFKGIFLNTNVGYILI